MLVQRYDFSAGEGREERLFEALQALGRWLIDREGCLKVEVMTQANGIDFSLVEHWRDDASRRAAGSAMDDAELETIKSSVNSMQQTGWRVRFSATSAL